MGPEFSKAGVVLSLSHQNKWSNCQEFTMLDAHFELSPVKKLANNFMKEAFRELSISENLAPVVGAKHLTMKV